MLSEISVANLDSFNLLTTVSMDNPSVDTVMQDTVIKCIYIVYILITGEPYNIPIQPWSGKKWLSSVCNAEV